MMGGVTRLARFNSLWYPRHSTLSCRLGMVLFILQIPLHTDMSVKQAEPPS